MPEVYTLPIGIGKKGAVIIAVLFAFIRQGNVTKDASELDQGHLDLPSLQRAEVLNERHKISPSR